VQFSVRERDTDRLVGDVGISTADGEPGVVKVGYTISPSSQRRGYATEAVGALVDYAFRTLGADVVRAYASADNAPSIRVAEHVGMHLIERFTGHDEDGEWSAVRYERRRDDPVA
jgi:RimJ/RimL family protein N-acetyltransferase